MQPSYLSQSAGAVPSMQLEDRVFDPRFQVTSKQPYLGEITTRALIWDYFRTQIAMPNESEILKRLGQNIEAVDELLCDGRVKAALNNRRAGLLSLKWTLDQNNAPARVFKTMKMIFDELPVTDLMSEMMMAVFYGYNVSEVVWEEKDGLILPTQVTGKAQRWFAYDDKNQLRVKTKVQQVQGEVLPPRKFLVTRFHPRYDDPYAGREALFNACYWPVKFRRIVMQWAMQWLEKYSVPWLDVTMEGGLQEDRLTEIVATIQKTYQDGIIAHPDNTKIEKMKMDESASVDNYTKWLDTLNREIDMAILGTNLTTEVKGGSFAATEAHMGVRDDLIKEDIRMVEATYNQLIEWVAWYNYPADTPLPRFKLYKSEPPTKERAEIDTLIGSLGVKFNKEYFSRSYGLNEEEFEMTVPEEVTPDVGAKDALVIQSAGIEAKDQATNTQTDAAIIAQQKKGYKFTEGWNKIFVYSTLKHQDAWKKALGHEIGNGYADQLDGWFEVDKGDGYHTLELGNDGKVEGRVVEISDIDLKLLDAWEERYKRIEVVLKSGDRAWAYILNK